LTKYVSEPTERIKKKKIESGTVKSGGRAIVIASYSRLLFAEGTSDVLNTALTGIVDPIVYGVFNTPVNAISGSAVCMFNISDVIETFMGSFKDQEAMDSNWLPVKKVRVV